MKATILILATLLAGIEVCSARAVPIWSYEALVREADTVLIVSVLKPSERTGAEETSNTQPFDKVRTTFRVQAVLKGKYEDKDWEYGHLAWGRKIAPGNPLGFVWFSQPGQTFMAFLKTDTGGGLLPVTGREDDEYSFIILPPSPLITMMNTQPSALTMPRELSPALAHLQRGYGIHFPPGTRFRLNSNGMEEVLLPSPQGGTNGWQPLYAATNRVPDSAANRRSP